MYLYKLRMLVLKWHAEDSNAVESIPPTLPSNVWQSSYTVLCQIRTPKSDRDLD